MITIEQLYHLYLETYTVSTDTRSCPQGCMFFALKGNLFDGNQFAHQALSNGASYAVVDDPLVVSDDRFLLVQDVLKTLQDLASFHRTRLGIPVLAITGTNGKTTTKELILSVLSEKFQVEATKGNLNNHIGVPLTLLSMKKQTTFGVVEMGANHPGEIEALCKIAKPNYGIITNVGKAHLEGFGSFAGVMKTKSELYRYLEHNEGVIFANGDNELLHQMLQGTKTISYGEINFSLVGGSIEKGKAMLSFNWRKDSANGTSFAIDTNLVGVYNFENALAAVCIAVYFGVVEHDICKALQNYVPTNNRSQLVKTASNEVIMDAYNANPTSMKKALENFNELSAKNKVMVLGGMKELGAYSHEEHQNIIDFANTMDVNRCVLIGDEYLLIATNSQIEKYKDVNEFIQHLHKHPIQDALLLVKGSRSNQLEKILPLL